MSAKYLLPCRCGQQIVVEPPQAGETIVCPCGASLEVPTMLEMTALEPVPMDSSQPSADSVWGWRQRMLLLGVVLAAMAAGAWLYLFLKAPVSRFDAIDPENIQQTARQLPPSLTWDVWEMMKQGLDRHVDQQLIRNREIHRWLQAATVVLALIGAALITAGLAAGRSAKKVC